MTKCTFHKFGTSGNIEKHDALCILPLNIGDFQYMIINIFNPTFSVNEKIYIFIWVWLLFLGFLSSVVIVYRIVIVFSPYIRAFVLRLRYRSANFSNLASKCVYPLISFNGANLARKIYKIKNVYILLLSNMYKTIRKSTIYLSAMPNYINYLI